MTFQEAFLKAETWQRKVVIVSLFHNARLAQNKKWKLSDTASYFKISIGLCSENIHLSEEYDKVKECHSRNEAIHLLRNESNEPEKAT